MINLYVFLSYFVILFAINWFKKAEFSFIHISYKWPIHLLQIQLRFPSRNHGLYDPPH